MGITSLNKEALKATEKTKIERKMTIKSKQLLKGKRFILLKSVLRFLTLRDKKNVY